MTCSQQQFLLVHLSFHYYHLTPPYSRQLLPTHANGFLNQIQSLLCAIQIAKHLGRILVVDDFYVDISDMTTRTPLSRIVDFSSLTWPCQDLSHHNLNDFHVSNYSHQMIRRPVHDWLSDVMTHESKHTHLEVDCCFYLCLDRDVYRDDLISLRFDPLFYTLTHPFIHSFEKSYHVVHYRLEDDFLNYFSTLYRPQIAPDRLGIALHQSYMSSMNTITTRKHPVVIVSGYFKHLETACADTTTYTIPHGQYQYDIPCRDQCFQFVPSRQDYEKIFQHLSMVPNTTRFREIDALMDFIIATSSSASSFLGVLESSFSMAIADFNTKTSRSFHLIHLGLLDASMFPSHALLRLSF